VSDLGATRNHKLCALRFHSKQTNKQKHIPMSINISQATRSKLHAGQQRVAGKFAELLQGRGEFFDFVVLMVCDEQQQEMFEADIDSRLARGL
jgi:hypothetical protein